jgi:hypothetical protein
VVDRAVVSREDAFGRLVETELPRAYRTAALILGDASEAEDAVQDAMVRAWQRILMVSGDSIVGYVASRSLVEGTPVNSFMAPAPDQPVFGMNLRTIVGSLCARPRLPEWRLRPDFGSGWVE